MKYAVIRVNTKQYKVEEGEEILVDQVLDDKKMVTEVLLVQTDKGIKIGDPTVKGAKVTLKNMGLEKGEKIHVFKYKSKSRYRKKIGSRPKFTRFAVESIS